LVLKTAKFAPSDDEVEEENDEEKYKISNNPPVDDVDRLPRRVRNKIHNSRLNRLKNREQEDKKKTKVIINSIKLFPNFNKEVDKRNKLKEEHKKKVEEEKKKQQKLIKQGVYYKDTDNLDYKVNKTSISLKNLNMNNNLISDRFENILKRKKLLEKYHHSGRRGIENSIKMQYRDNQDYCYDEGDNTNLKIIN